MADITSFMLTFSMSDIVTWGDDEFDGDDYYANQHLQMLANHLSVPFPICYLYLQYFDYFPYGTGVFHLFTNFIVEEKAMICIDLHKYDETDQCDIVMLGVKCESKHAKRTEACLKTFKKSSEYPEQVNLTVGKKIKYLESILEKYKT